MNRRIDQLGQLLQEMQDRYGSNDPVVSQLKIAIAQCSEIALSSNDQTLPFGERRSANAKSNDWTVPLRQKNAAYTRKNVFAECKRVEHRALGY